MLMILQWTFLIAALITAYCIWIRPVLHERPELRALYARTDTYYDAFVLRFQGIKTKLVAGLGMAGSAIFAVGNYVIPYIVQLWDTAAPAALQIDWTPISAKLPEWAWPIILFVMFWAVSYFRNLTDKRAEGGNDRG